MKNVSKKTRFFSVILLTGTTAIGLEASAPVYKPKITSVPGLPTQQQYDAAFDALGSVINVGMVSFGGSTTSPKTTKFPNLSESNLLAIRRDNLGIKDGDVFKTLEACRQQLTQNDSKKDAVKFLCGKYEIKQLSTGLRAYLRSVPFFDPNGPAKSVPFNFPLAGGIKSTNALDKAKENKTLVDFFTKNAGMPTTQYVLKDMSNIAESDKTKNPEEKFRLLPENFMRLVFYPHYGLRGELMAHFIAPFAIGNDWDKWKDWGKKLTLVAENTEEVQKLMEQALYNLAKKDKPQEIIDLLGVLPFDISQIEVWYGGTGIAIKDFWDSRFRAIFSKEVKLPALAVAVFKGWASVQEKNANSVKWRAAQALGITKPQP